MNIQSETIKNWVTISFYVILVVLVVKYMFIDWEEIGDEVSESMEKMSNMVSCEITCNDFSYSGFCAYKEEILNFMINQSICGVQK